MEDENQEELRAIEIDFEVTAAVAAGEDRHENESHSPLGGEHRRTSSRSRSQDVMQGKVVAASAVPNPYGAEEDDVCGVCLENPGRGSMVALWCCRNLLCIADARKLGACPFCREEPLMWNLRTQ